MQFRTFLAKKLAKTLRTEELFDKEVLHIACEQHLLQTIRRFELAGAPNVSLMWLRCHSLLDDSAMDRTSQEALAAWTEATAVGQPRTRFFAEAGPRGRMIFITTAPWLDETRFLQALPDRSYLAFVLPFRRTFYGLPGWEQREFVHWIFTAGKDEQGYLDISVSLFYMESFERLLQTVKLQLTQRTQSNRADAMIVPTAYLPGETAEALIGGILKLDAETRRLR